MEYWYGAALVKNARQCSRGNEKRKLAALHAGIAAGAAMAVTLLLLLLEKGIGNTGGLSGLGTRSVLETAATLLQYAVAVLTPFWNLGFLFVALLWARGQSARTDDLLMGFRRFGPYLRLLLLEGIITVAGGIFCLYLSSYLYMATPWAEPVMDFAQAAGLDMETANAMLYQMEPAQMDALLQAMVPMMVIWGVLCLAVLVPMLYRFRMAEFILLEDKRMGGLAAMLLSARMLRKRRFKLFLLDLRFWWYYGLKVLCVVLMDLGPLLGVVSRLLPNATGLQLILCYIVYYGALFAIEACFRPRVQTAYALAYEQLRTLEPVMPKPAETPKNLPWDEE